MNPLARARLIALRVGATLLLCMAMIGVAHGDPVAMVTDLQGKAVISTAGRTADAAMLVGLEVGAQAQLQPTTTMVVLYLGDGGEYVLKGPATVVFRAALPEVTNGAPALKRPPPAGEKLRINPNGMGQGALVMRSSLGAPRIRLLSANGTRVLDTQPELHWQEPQPGLRYSVEIADETGRSLYEAQVEGPSFTLPASLQLKDGMAYTWEVAARLPDGRKYASKGEFSIASAELRAQTAAARALAQESVSSMVTFAIWLEQMELRDEARKAWRALAVQRPDDPQIRAMAQR